ncbi:MAG: membrane protein insertase YidC [Candidatus Faecousia sp.]|nr:membrane protein insertase YidC [Candidatus Faecousia sp.]
MFLSFSIADIIQVPFGYLLDWLYQLSGSYGFALIVFSVVVQLVMLPMTAKSKKSMMKMSRLQPQMQELQRRYADDPQRQNQALQNLYKEEGVSMGGGCLWSLLPLLIILPLYTVVRQPIVYMLHESLEMAEQIIAVLQSAAPEAFSANSYYHQITAAQLLSQPEYSEVVKAAIPALSEATLAGINFSFLGINLGAIPSFNVFAASFWCWPQVGLFLLALLSAGNQVVTMWISQKMNDSLVTNKDGIQDEETAKKSQTAQTNKVMMLTMPLMMLWIGFTVPASLSLYWFVGGVVRTVEDVILNKRYRTIYDAEDAERLKRRLEQDRIEAEKERIRAERRAANPDGITDNTSKKKMQKKQREQEQAERAAASKEYALRKGLSVEEEEVPETMSGIPDRPYCKGRNFAPNRYASKQTEE